MAKIESRINALGLVLPPAFTPPPGLCASLRERAPDRKSRHDRRAWAAKLTALSMLSNLKCALGDLDRISHWVRIFGMVNSAPGFVQQPGVIKGALTLSSNFGGVRPEPTPVARWVWPSYHLGCRWKLRAKSRSQLKGIWFDRPIVGSAIARRGRTSFRL
jgi:hypothetical protein